MNKVPEFSRQIITKKDEYGRLLFDARKHDDVIVIYDSSKYQNLCFFVFLYKGFIFHVNPKDRSRAFFSTEIDFVVNVFKRLSYCSEIQVSYELPYVGFETAETWIEQNAAFAHSVDGSVKRLIHGNIDDEDVCKIQTLINQSNDRDAIEIWNSSPLPILSIHCLNADPGKCIRVTSHLKDKHGKFRYFIINTSTGIFGIE